MSANRKSANPMPTPFDETPAADVDTTGMGGELTPFYPCVDAIGRPFLIHDILSHVETEYGARMFVHVAFVDGEEDGARYTLSFTEKAPAYAQLMSIAEAEHSPLPMGPVTLARKGKSYVVVSANLSGNVR